MSGPTARRVLTRLARRGVQLEILAESTQRRVPQALVRELSEAGAAIERIGQGKGWIPMHDKFALVETDSEHVSILGSFNWSEPSRRFNREIGIVSGGRPLFEELAARWEELARYAPTEGPPG